MSTELGWALLGLLTLFGWIGVGFAREQLQTRNRMRLREMLHRERMAALDKGVELPDSDTDDILQQSFAAGDPASAGRWGVPAASRHALRRAALGLGLVLLFGGLGWIVGMAAVPETRETLGMPQMASLGAIPVMVGVGLLLFWIALRREGR